MSNYPDVGACFGFKEPVCEVEAPWWFEHQKWRYVVGPKLEASADFTDRPCEIPGAGLTVRRVAWRRLRDNGFTFRSAGRRGAELLAGEDTELCCALKLSGWRLRYDPALRLTHFIPRHRLSWDYLRRQARGWGMSTPMLDPYYGALREVDGGTRGGILNKVRDYWIWHVLAISRQLFSKPLISAGALLRFQEGDDEQLAVDTLIGRLIGLLRVRGARDAAVRSLGEAVWRQNCCDPLWGSRKLDANHAQKLNSL